MIGVIPWGMDDIEAAIDASKHFKYHERNGTTPFNRMSSLPESKKHLKRALKERIRLLTAAYISLATFVDDDVVDFLESNWEVGDKGKIKRTKRIYEKLIRDIERLRGEIKVFDAIEVTNSLPTHDALDS